ncbi:MAG TPA: ShlB/FhaC/HecB family hemolysin secretion/activation protein, partial [Reyranellaceae bacterium]|nr:ShlB/FhaC/HecB family hemolysin secretion/activation protein [Reyranellaceae bacterium]
AIAAPLLADAPLRSATLERAIGLIRDFPGLKVADVALMRTDAGPGLYALRIKVTRDRVRALAYMDNRGTDSIGRTRFYSSFALSSSVIDGDQLRLDLFTMPGRRFRYLYGQLLGSVPIGRDGLRLTLSASKGDQHLGGGDTLNGDSTNLSAQLSYPVMRSRALTMVARLGVTDSRSSADGETAERLRDRLRVARAALELSSEGKTRLAGELSLSRGLGFDGMTEVGDPLASRSDAGGRFTKATLTAQVIRPLSRRVRLQAVAAGQYASRPLLSVEEFALGGSKIGRAFAFNALTGDRGVGGGLEVSYRLPESKRMPKGLELFGFVDGGATFEAGSSAATDRRRSLASIGAGTRFSLSGALFSAEVGVPVATDGHDRSPRLFLSTFRAF